MTPSIHNWIDGYLAVRARAFERRGFIELDSGATWPRTTVADAIEIAAMFDASIRAHGAPGIARRWNAVFADLAAALGSPLATFSGNRSLWSTLEIAAVFLDDVTVAAPEPRLWSALLAQLAGSTPRNVGPSGDGPFKHFENAKTYLDLYLEQFKYLRDLRGFDRRQPEPGMVGPEKPIPRTTNADVIALADYWSKQLASVKEVMGHASVVTRWTRARTDVDQHARTGDPGAVFPNNNTFWRDLQNTAIHVAVADEAPSRWDLARDALTDSVMHLPQTLGHVAEKGADLVAGAAHAVGKVANEAGKGLFAGFGTPLLVGAGLLGVFLISRAHRQNEAT